MKKLCITLLCVLFSTTAYGFYDFCESPADYNTFPQAYDVRTEYWKDIPKYEPDDIKYDNLQNKHPLFPQKKKNTKENKNNDDSKS